MADAATAGECFARALAAKDSGALRMAIVYGGFTSVKSAIASSAVSNSGPSAVFPPRLRADDRVPAARLIQTREH